jgi:arginine/lysine/ornithine decarboxylase
MIVPYPPGIPLLLPGEEITAEVLEQVTELRGQGHHFQGFAADKTEIIDIIDL